MREGSNKKIRSGESIIGLESRANNSITHFVPFVLFWKDLGVMVRFQS